MLARRAAAEIVAGDQDLGLAIGRLVEHEIGILAAVVTVTLLREEARAKPGTLDGLEVLLGDDHVSVDVNHLQRRRDAFERGELVHWSCPRLTHGLLMAALLARVKGALGRARLVPMMRGRSIGREIEAGEEEKDRAGGDQRDAPD